jgi:deoxyribodipyrimidine photolyase
MSFADTFFNSMARVQDIQTRQKEQKDMYGNNIKIDANSPLGSFLSENNMMDAIGVTGKDGNLYTSKASLMKYSPMLDLWGQAIQNKIQQENLTNMQTPVDIEVFDYGQQKYVKKQFRVSQIPAQLQAMQLTEASTTNANQMGQLVENQKTFTVPVPIKGSDGKMTTAPGEVKGFGLQNNSAALASMSQEQQRLESKHSMDLADQQMSLQMREFNAKMSNYEKEREALAFAENSDLIPSLVMGLTIEMLALLLVLCLL